MSREENYPNVDVDASTTVEVAVPNCNSLNCTKSIFPGLPT